MLYFSELKLLTHLDNLEIKVGGAFKKCRIKIKAYYNMRQSSWWGDACNFQLATGQVPCTVTRILLH